MPQCSSASDIAAEGHLHIYTDDRGHLYPLSLKETMFIVPATENDFRSEFSKLRMPNPHDKVYNDECMLTFDSPYSDNGLYVNMTTLMGYSVDWFQEDSRRTGCKLYLHEKWTQIPIESSSDSSDPTKLAIGIDGGFAGVPKFEVLKEHSLVVMVEAGEPQIFPLSDQTIPEFVRNICQGVIDHQGMRANMQLDVWEADTDVFESKYAADLPQLSNGKTISNHPAAWRCEKSGDSSNLWLNLSTGYIGGGRKNWDGSGGSGAALEHYIETGRQYPLCVKLGTITPHGADVWSYADDEDSLVKVPRLAEYLSHWGIDIMRLEKTDKTLAEQEVDINKSYDWSKVLGNGVDLQIVSAPGCIGLANIGSSCYMNVILQILFSIPEFKRRYFDQADQIRHSLPTPDASMDLPCQMSKLATALLGDRYVTPSPAARAVVSAEESAPPELQLEKFTVAPRMFKHIVGRGHRDFSSGRQQDASEYFQFLLDQIDRTERTALGRMGAPHDALSTPSVFKFELEERYQCSVTGQVRYMCGSQTAQNVLELRIPLNRAVNREEVAAHQLERKRKLTECSGKADDTNISASCDEDPKLVVPFAACLESHFAEDTVEYRNPSLGPDSPMTPAMKSIRFGNFPRYLMIKLGRYYVDTDWTMKKIDAEVPVPERIDLSQLRARGGLQPNEVPMATPEEGSGDSAGTAEMFAELPDEGIVAQLVSMGFSENGSRRAALATHNTNADAAMGWVFEHMEDPNFNDPLPTVVPPTAPAAAAGDSVEADAEALGMLQSFGYSQKQCTAALKATGNNLERAADWLFSRADDIDVAVAEVESGAVAEAGGVGTASSISAQLVAQNDGAGVYSLQGIVSHVGRNTEHGHYVCHIKKGEGKWIFFNDDKVAISQTTPFDRGFMYLFKREDNDGHI